MTNSFLLEWQKNIILNSMYAFVYILECSDGSYYTGSTSKYIFDRVAEHQNGNGANYTKKKRPVKLVYFKEFASIQDAFLRE